jgi:putative chitinase
MYLTNEQLHKCIPLANDANIAKYLPFFNKYFEQYGITNEKRCAAFLAQISHESGNLRYVEEIADGSNYEFREDLGNLEFEALQIAHALGTTTGRMYKGYGLIQITGYYNHKKCGKALGLDLIHTPYLLKKPEYAVQSAMWFWNTHGCNELADVFNFKAITRRINGGVKTLPERLVRWEIAKKVLLI